MASEFNKCHTVLIEKSLGGSEPSVNSLLMSVGNVTKRVMAGALLVTQLTGLAGAAGLVGMAAHSALQSPPDAMEQVTTVRGFEFAPLGKFSISHPSYEYSTPSYQHLRASILESEHDASEAIFSKQLAEKSTVYDIGGWLAHIKSTIGQVENLKSDEAFLSSLQDDERVAFDRYIDAYEQQHQTLFDADYDEAVFFHRIEKSLFKPTSFVSAINAPEGDSSDFGIFTGSHVIQNSTPVYNLDREVTPVISINNEDASLYLLNHKHISLNDYVHFVRAHEELHLTINGIPGLENDIHAISSVVDQLDTRFDQYELEEFKHSLTRDISVLMEEVLADAWGIIETARTTGSHIDDEISNYRDANFALYFDDDHHTSPYLDRIDFNSILESDNHIDALAMEIQTNSIPSMVIKNTLIKYENLHQMQLFGRDNHNSAQMSEIAKALSPALLESNVTAFDGTGVSVTENDRLVFSESMHSVMDSFAAHGGSLAEADNGFETLYNLKEHAMSFQPTPTEKLTADFSKLNSVDLTMPKKAGVADQAGDSTGFGDKPGHTGGQDNHELDRTPRGVKPCPKVDVRGIEPMMPQAHHESLAMNRTRLAELLEQDAPARAPEVPDPSNSSPKM